MHGSLTNVKERGVKRRVSEAKKATHVVGGREDKRGELALGHLTVPVCRCEGFPRDDPIQDMTMGEQPLW